MAPPSTRVLSRMQYACIMAPPSTRALSRMQYACIMAVSYQISLPNASVAHHSQPTMPRSVSWVASLLDRYNELRDTTASLLSEVCHNVATEHRLQPLNGESMTHHYCACLDIRARGSDQNPLARMSRQVLSVVMAVRWAMDSPLRGWRRCTVATFDIRVFHPNAQSNNSGPISAAYNKHESIK